MQRYKVTAILFQIQKLVYVRHIGAGDNARASAVGVVWSDVTLRRALKHRLGHHPFTDQDDADRAAVIVDRRTLPLFPAQQQHLGVLAPHDEVSGVFVIREESVRFVISLPDQQRREPIDDLSERRDSRQSLYPVCKLSER